MMRAFIRKDDMFVMGNIALLSLSKGLAHNALSITRLFQTLRPQNGAGFIIEAMHHFSQGRAEQALSVMERFDPDTATVNRDEALAFHLYLLAELGFYDAVAQGCALYLTPGYISSEAARHTIEQVRDDTSGAWPLAPKTISLPSDI